MAQRGKNLDDEAVLKIVEILDGWVGKLTWESLISDIEMRRGTRYTRQALNKHKRIVLAFQQRKKTVRFAAPVEKTEYSSPELQILSQKYDRCLAEKQRLMMENSVLVEKFSTWVRNASLHGLSEDQLNAALDSYDREISGEFKEKLKARARRSQK